MYLDHFLDPLSAWLSPPMIAGLAVALGIALNNLLRKQNIDAPFIGPAVWLSKWPAAIRNLRFARESIHEGYAKHGKTFFQIPTMRRSEIYICNPLMIKEYRDAPDEHLSMFAVMSDEFQFKWTAPGGQYDAHRLGTPVMAKALGWQRLRTNNPKDPFFEDFAATCLDGLDHGIRMLQETRPSPISSSNAGDTESISNADWVSVPCFKLALDVVSRMTTKSLFGQSDFWDEPDFLNMCRQYADAVPRDAMILHLIPTFLRPYFSELLPVRKLHWKLTAVICNEIGSRSRKTTTEDPPGDLLDFGIKWIEDPKYVGMYNDRHVANLLSFTVFAALHTTSQLITLTIYELATRPEYIQLLRDEIDKCMLEYGSWTKASIDAMHNLDSFMKETQRCNVLNASSLERIALKPFTFSNGLHIPKGSWMGTPHSPLFQDERYYSDPERFDGLRFARMRNSEDPQIRRECLLTATSEHSMHFGHGRHTCPGRWMAADEAKLVMARLVSSYDIALFSPRPANIKLLKFNVPSMTANIWLRKRS
uniref:Cytochrome P450 monooxygenase spdQ n=1 Tax=Cordana terrestris TaxID=1293529 RepID=SPDQ_CORTS|nr:putative cytochrome P450 [Cordana terrestris]